MAFGKALTGAVPALPSIMPNVGVMRPEAVPGRRSRETT
jgi:hypothetical protein